MAFGPGPFTRALFDAQEAVGIQAEHTGAQRAQRMERVAHDEAGRGKSRVQPVERGLTLLEVVQIDPSAFHAVDPAHNGCCAPVCLLDARFIENGADQLADDVPFLL